MMRKCTTAGCKNNAQLGELVCLPCEIASWSNKLHIQICGHPTSDIVQRDDGTAYCAECAKEALERR